MLRVVTVVREPDGWKVDLRWWLAMGIAESVRRGRIYLEMLRANPCL